MKFHLTLLFFVSSLALSAQVDLKSLMGKWDIKSCTQTAVSQNIAHITIRIGDTDLGDYVIEQTLTDDALEAGECTWVVLLGQKGGNKIMHELLLEDGGCKCWLLGEYSYELKNGILTISNSKNKLELVRKS